MVTELEMVWMQLKETYDAFAELIGPLTDEAVNWRPKEDARSICDQVLHTAYGNLVYCSYIIGKPKRVPEPKLTTVKQCLDRLTLSLEQTKESFEKSTLDDLAAIRDQDWRPLGPAVIGPLTGSWFAHQIVRHSAYHLGQANLLCELQGLQSQD